MATCCEDRCDNTPEATDHVRARARRDALISAQAAANMRNLAIQAVHSIPATDKGGRDMQALAADAIHHIHIDWPDTEED